MWAGIVSDENFVRHRSNDAEEWIAQMQGWIRHSYHFSAYLSDRQQLSSHMMKLIILTSWTRRKTLKIMSEINEKIPPAFGFSSVVLVWCRDHSNPIMNNTRHQNVRLLLSNQRNCVTTQDAINWSHPRAYLKERYTKRITIDPDKGWRNQKGDNNQGNQEDSLDWPPPGMPCISRLL